MQTGWPNFCGEPSAEYIAPSSLSQCMSSRPVTSHLTVPWPDAVDAPEPDDPPDPLAGALPPFVGLEVPGSLGVPGVAPGLLEAPGTATPPDAAAAPLAPGDALVD